MVVRRSVRRWLSGTLVLAILFAQLATAAYSCPANGEASGTAAQAESAMPCGQMMGSGMALDPGQPGLCQQHCQFGNTQQAGDAAQLLLPPAVALGQVFSVAPAPAPELPSAAWADHQLRRERAPPLPHSIAYCCFRL
ncbi:MAG: hypothetical protein JHC40_13965 [Burkholderiales bacterium]|jgi:hypothetical protein|nr:hypothetical protein [Burkholderiales bacterium]